MALTSPTPLDSNAMRSPHAGHRRPIFFQHFSRTGGVAFRNHLANVFDAARSLVGASIPANLSRDPKDFDFVEGIVHASYIERFARRPFVITIVRDPIDRAVSVYHWIRSADTEEHRSFARLFGKEQWQQRLAVHRAMRMLDLYDFIRAKPKLAERYFGNVQTRTLSNTEMVLGGKKLDEASANLERCDLILTTSLLDQSSAWLGSRLGCGALGPMRREGHATGRSRVDSLDARTREALADLTSLDSMLYERAVELYRRRLHEWLTEGSPPEPTLTWHLPPSGHDFSFDQAFRGVGWEPREFLDGRWFCWTGGRRRAFIELSSSGTGDHELYCEVAHVLKPSILDGVAVTVNGHHVDVTPRQDGDVVALSATIPGRMLGRSDGRVRLDFLVPETVRPCDVNRSSNDARELGIALSRIRLVPTPTHRSAPAESDAATTGTDRVARVFMPLLGALRHHEPRPLFVPPRYARARTPEDAPPISIVTPSLNQGAFLAQAIHSVAEQRYPGVEHVVEDGGSTDTTREVLERYGHTLHHWRSAPDAGQATAINRGFARTTGEVLAWLNGDDILLPGSLTYVARFFRRHADVDVVYGHRVLIDCAGLEIGRWVLPRHSDAVLPWIDFIPQETLFWRRRLWDRVGGVDERLHFVIDWDLILRFRQAGARFVRLPRFLAALRVHPAQKLATMSQTGAEEARALRCRVHGRTVTQAEVLAKVWPYLAKHVALHRLYRMRLLRY